MAANIIVVSFRQNTLGFIEICISAVQHVKEWLVYSYELENLRGSLIKKILEQVRILRYK